MMSQIVKNTSINAGKDFFFHGCISQEVLENYLSRAITYWLFPDLLEDSVRAILNVGAKYLCRANVAWNPSAENEDLSLHRAWMEKLHAYDPDIIFEACIFETCGPEMNQIRIPAHVFSAFGKEPEDRCFDYEKMKYANGYAVNVWNPTHSVPDISTEEFQMFVYHRACLYIDNGFESIHLGQTVYMGENDPDRKCWTKVVHMIRAYAAEHARRRYVLINCHHIYQNFVGTDGVMLADFNMYPLRLIPAEDEVPHEITESTPQRCTINLHRDAPYKKGLSGTSPSGWHAENYPYLVEFDNYGGRIPAEEPFSVWGYDEISWIVNQPDAYRRAFLTEVRKLVSGLHDNGYVALIGSRNAYREDLGKMDFYRMNTKSALCPTGFSDEEAIIEAFRV